MNTLTYFKAATEAMFAQEGAMTVPQFISYAHEVLRGEGAEYLYERIAEIRGEIAQFGDAGPGALFHLRPAVAEFNQIAARYEQLTGHSVPRLALPSPR